MEEGLGTAMRPSLGEDLRPTSPELWDSGEKKTLFLSLMVYFSKQPIINIKILWKPVFVPTEKKSV